MGVSGSGMAFTPALCASVFLAAGFTNAFARIYRAGSARGWECNSPFSAGNKPHFCRSIFIRLALPKS
jgi:hypothetical protein